MGSGYATNSGISLTINATQKMNNKTGIFRLAQFDSRYGEYLDVICKRLSFSFVFLFHCCDYFMIYIFFKMVYMAFFSSIVAFPSVTLISNCNYNVLLG